MAAPQTPSFFPSFKDNPAAAYGATAVIAVVLLVLPFVVGTQGNAWVRILDFALLYVMLALGLNIVVGYAGLLDLGYVAFYAVGAYMYALLASPHLAENFEFIAEMFPDGLHNSIWLVVPLGAALAAFFGVTDAVEPNFSTRVKMGQSSDVYAVAITADGKALFAKKEVKVTLGGCGG